VKNKIESLITSLTLLKEEGIFDLMEGPEIGGSNSTQTQPWFYQNMMNLSDIIEQLI
jgi:hypothetical protein